MKNVSCFQLSIDRSKAPKKMGTFKDISLFGNFIFPLVGEYAGGVIARSLAGTGKVSKKTKDHLRKISSRCSPLLDQQVHLCRPNYLKAVKSSFLVHLAKVMCTAFGS